MTETDAIDPVRYMRDASIAGVSQWGQPEGACSRQVHRVACLTPPVARLIMQWVSPGCLATAAAHGSKAVFQLVMWCVLPVQQLAAGSVHYRREDMAMSVSTQDSMFRIDDFKSAVESADAEALAALYHDDAQIDMINQNSPPANPRRIHGKDEISAYLKDVYNRDMKHFIEQRVQQGDTGAFVERCRYADGVGVLAASVFETRNRRIFRQTTVEAWDS